VKAQNGRDGGEFLRGGPVENWYAPSLRSGGPDTIAEWSELQISQFLQSGSNHSGISFGSMSDVIVNSTRFLSAEDSAATAKYLKTLLDRPANGRTRFAYDEQTDRELASGDVKKRGALLYLDNCPACHRPDGRGYEGVFPSLAGNRVVESDNPLSLVSIVLEGSKTSRTSITPAQFASAASMIGHINFDRNPTGNRPLCLMPAFAWRLTDQNAADIISFIRSS
jgi:hypothetical protein